MNGLRFHIGWLLLVSVGFWAKGQQTMHGLVDFTNAVYNPATIGMDNYMAAELMYRSQQTMPGVRLTSALLSLKYPIFNKVRDPSMTYGLVAGQDQTGLDGLLTTYTMGGLYAVNLLPAQRYHRLCLGTGLSYFRQTAAISQLTTGQQYVPGVGFDPSQPNGEISGDLDGRYFTWDLGLAWSESHRKYGIAKYANVALLSANRPRESNWSEARLNPILYASAGHQVYRKRHFALQADVRLWAADRLFSAAVGLTSKMNMRRGRTKQRLDLSLFYTQNQGVNLGVTLVDDRRFSVGASYEVPLNSHVAHQGAFEIGLEVKRLRKSKRKRRSAFYSRRPARPASVDDDKLSILGDSAAVEPIDSVLLADSIPPKEAGMVDSLLLYFTYEHNSRRPKDEEVAVLEELLTLLRQYPEAEIDLIGHTDDTGSHRYNQQLSEWRAEFIYELLVYKGIDPDRMTYTGAGELYPLNDNSDEEDRSANRRLEVIIYY
ncbi:OmpA family protein [Marinoscillum furvescens]|uniref:Type IX secretion system PorP/SprF family membrane protein n=1 Tax=Marinoscillum furvescens DSM 4134 TaxID=1122208 RepID=A0A3D9KZE3_MARFU|nr:OmpA family protein [Marinoscillum furvescens]RED92228.1 type IX secretion system PorP/SprF family membrane protein [Marinoscillum furvescens DSM 4134]